MNARLFPCWLTSGALVFLLVFLLAGCGGGTATRSDEDQTFGPPDAVPKVEPKSKHGNMSSYVVMGRRYETKDSSKGYVERGQASWYGNKFHGRRTSSGEVYDMHQMTAAHKTLPLPSYVQVTNLENGRVAVVRVNDRGPFHGGRIIDLSYAAARKLGVVAAGTAKVEVRSIDPRDHGGLVKAPPPARLEHQQRAAGPFEDPVLAADDQLYLQVGAFDQLANAEELRQRLLAHVPEPVNIRPGAEAEVAPYKVRVGPLGSRAEAEAVSQRLASLGLAQGMVIGR
ncbi:septal ring lytic transglycosylase RlpA family protein [Thiorhodovibrio frisius]|uniref:Endolytic peptidoglycan transglycosylase RlpA n=1 Tax=Thiorhodovibrio frisius TaxID=631362 RepID=H8Z6U5_9GAMM|nr:septal ring lytic transglycosylase RlpA family protein [Thiorhodovibrio frisius]EIC19730.1 rare lipoprotein A [Thiorhodovibrio frisius]WPL20302.1 RlpA-like protein precursor [Thiorhodovibrio frisius]